MTAARGIGQSSQRVVEDASDLPGVKPERPDHEQRSADQGPAPRSNYGDIGEGLLKPDENAWRPHHERLSSLGGLTSVTVFGPFIGPVGSITGLPMPSKHKIEFDPSSSITTVEVMMALLPVAAVLSLTLWICLTFLFPLGPAGSPVHLAPGAGRERCL